MFKGIRAMPGDAYDKVFDDIIRTFNDMIVYAEGFFSHDRVLKVKKLNDKAVIPKYAKDGDSGFDLVSLDTKRLYPGMVEIFPTGLSFEIPVGYEIQIRPRSGLACKFGVTVVNSPGTIDSGFIGEVKVGLINVSNDAYHVSKGDRIAQAVLAPVAKAVIMEVEELSETERGGSGFGSSGR